jgi:hypothetical protein
MCYSLTSARAFLSRGYSLCPASTQELSPPLEIFLPLYENQSVTVSLHCTALMAHTASSHARLSQAGQFFQRGHSPRTGNRIRGRGWIRKDTDLPAASSYLPVAYRERWPGGWYVPLILLPRCNTKVRSIPITRNRGILSNHWRFNQSCIKEAFNPHSVFSGTASRVQAIRHDVRHFRRRNSGYFSELLPCLSHAHNRTFITWSQLFC